LSEEEQVEEEDSRGSRIVFANRRIKHALGLINSLPYLFFSHLDLLLSKLID